MIPGSQDCWESSRRPWKKVVPGLLQQLDDPAGTSFMLMLVSLWSQDGCADPSVSPSQSPSEVDKKGKGMVSWVASLSSWRVFLDISQKNFPMSYWSKLVIWPALAAREAGKTSRWPGRRGLEIEGALPDMAVRVILTPAEVIFPCCLHQTRRTLRTRTSSCFPLHPQNVAQCSALRRCPKVPTEWMSEWVSEWINQYLTFLLPCFYHQQPVQRQLFIHMQTKLGLTTNKPIMQISPSSSNKPLYLWPLDMLFSLPRTFFPHLHLPHPSAHGQLILPL